MWWTLFFGVERVKEGLRKLDFGLQFAQREIPKYNSRIREWYLKVKDIVYRLEDLFEDIELPSYGWVIWLSLFI